MVANSQTTKVRAKPARWRKEPHETGLRSIGAQPRGYELRKDGDVLIWVSPAGGGWQAPLKGWYWVGFDINTYNTRKLFATAEEAKADADAFYRAKLKEVA